MVEGLIVGLIWLLIIAVVVAFVCWIVTRLLVQFFPGSASWAWIVWAIGGLVVLLFALRLFAPSLP